MLYVISDTKSLTSSPSGITPKLLFASFIFGLLAHTFAIPSRAQPPADRADSILRKAMIDRKIPGLQAAVIANGRVVFSRNYGVANMQTPVPVIDDTVFSVNSVTKAFTGIAVMQEVERGKLDLSAPISTYLTDVPSSWGKVTVR